MAEIYIDTETVGLHGLIVLVQYAEGNGEIKLFSPWEKPVKETLELFEWFANNQDGVTLFNAAFDWFHIYKMWTTWKLLAEVDPNIYPEEEIDLIINLEERARDYPKCLKPVKALDLFLHARKGPFQSCMDRKDIKIRRVPTQLAWLLAEELEQRIPLRDIYFARRKDKYTKKWQVQDRKDTYGAMDTEWKDIVVRFKPSSALKALAVDALNIPEGDILRFGDISPKLFPVEFGYAPYAKAAMKLKLRNKSKEKKRSAYAYRETWPDFIKEHIVHWGHNQQAREYAKNDIVYTRALRLHKDFINAEMGDDDSTLACMVGAGRWRGYKVDLDGIKQLKEKAINRKFITINNQQCLLPTAPNDVKRYITEVCDETEKLGIIEDNTAKVTLERLEKDWNLPCSVCNGEGCHHCGMKGTVKHPAAVRAGQILSARKAKKEEELYDKILAAGRFHASFKVIGALSSRMSGADGLNPQGIKSTKEVKSRFILTQDGYVLCGGDFAGFEVTIAEAVYADELLRKDLLTCEACEGQMIFVPKERDFICQSCGSNKGKKIHALFGINVFPHMTYEQIKATEGKEPDIYTDCKRAVFAMFYGGEGFTLQSRLGVPLDVAEEGHRRFTRRYKGVGKSQQKVKNDFGALRQPNGIGTKVEWHEPKDAISTLFGFTRFFTLENRICKTLYQLANKLPKAMKDMKLRVVRDTKRGRVQTVGGAVCSALYGAAFAIQGYTIRAATNHVIQGTGAQVTKMVQRRIWDLQPSGVNDWIVQPLNIHDSIMTPVKKGHVKAVEEVVYSTVESVRPKVPLIKMPWFNYLANWADKNGPVINNQTSKRYKDRRAVTKDGFSIYDVSRQLTGEIENGSWRLLIDEEIDQWKEELKKAKELSSP